jgi:hypothetical protein
MSRAFCSSVAAKRLVRSTRWAEWDVEKSGGRWEELRSCVSKHPHRVNSVVEFSEEVLSQPAVWLPPSGSYWSQADWSLEKLASEYGAEDFAFGTVGSTDDPVLMKLGAYLAYCRTNNDQTPLYLFDPTFEVQAPELLERYSVPECWRGGKDLMAVLPLDARPDFRWMLVGPQRSGSAFHTDPVGSAWNACISGEKHWVITEPCLEPLLARSCEQGDEPDHVEWFLNMWPCVREELMGSAERCWYEFVQREGEIVYIPQGWGHAVMNLSTTVAVTQNLVQERDVQICWDFLYREHSEIAAGWRQRLQHTRPEVVERVMREVGD